MRDIEAKDIVEIVHQVEVDATVEVVESCVLLAAEKDLLEVLNITITTHTS